MGAFPQALHVSGSAIYPTAESDESVANDPRGLLLMFEEPRPNAKYIMGLDPTVGVTGWSRATMVDGDHKIDNAAIEIFRVDAVKCTYVGDDGKPLIDEVTKTPKFYHRDLQVAEFAAPCDAVEIARIAYLLGRIYCGVEEDECELIFEAYPGPGILTTQELLRLSYRNLWQWEYIDNVAEATNRIGWRSWGESQKILWYRSRRHLMERRVKIQSKFLLDEYANAVIDVAKMRAKAAYGSKDDRIQAANMALWAAHKWTYDEHSSEPVSQTADHDPQRSAPVLGEYRGSYKDQWAAAMDGWDW